LLAQNALVKSLMARQSVTASREAIEFLGAVNTNFIVIEHSFETLS
jgi:hypothetical protein